MEKSCFLGVAGIVGLCIGISSIVLGYYYFISNLFSYSNKMETVDYAYCNLIVELLLHHKGFYNKADPVFTVEVIKSLFFQLNENGIHPLNFNDIQYISENVYSRENFIHLQELLVVKEPVEVSPGYFNVDKDGFIVSCNNLRGNSISLPRLPSQEEAIAYVAYINESLHVPLG